MKRLMPAGYDSLTGAGNGAPAARSYGLQLIVQGEPADPIPSVLETCMNRPVRTRPDPDEVRARILEVAEQHCRQCIVAQDRNGCNLFRQIAPNFLVAKLSLPVNSVKELIEYACANPGTSITVIPGLAPLPISQENC